MSLIPLHTLTPHPTLHTPHPQSLNTPQVRDLEARLNAEREELATLSHEKQALQARLSKLREAETGDLQVRGG